VKVIGSAVASLLIGIRITLDLIGYSTSPEDFESLGPKVRAMLDYIASQPGLLVYGLPLVLLFAIVWSILDQRANQRLTPRAQSQNGSVKDQTYQYIGPKEDSSQGCVFIDPDLILTEFAAPVRSRQAVCAISSIETSMQRGNDFDGAGRNC
jgi:hypothetical protein